MPGFGFLAGATRGIIVKAGFDVVHGELGADQFVHGVDSGPRGEAIGDVGLIGDYDDHIAPVLELAHGFCDAGQHLELR